MNNTLKVLLVAGAGAWLLKDQLRFLLTGAPKDQPAPGTATPPPASSDTGTTPPALDSAAITKAKLLAWAKTQPQYMMQGELLDGWQWAYGYRAVRGTDPGDPGLFMDASRRVSLDEFWQLASGHGLSGVPNWSAQAWGY